MYFYFTIYKVKGKNGPFYNKEFYLDENKIDTIDCCIKTFIELEIINKNIIKVYETFDRNCPEIINIEISNLRNKCGR